LVDFVGDTRYVVAPHLPATFSADSGHHHVDGIVHVEAGWSSRGVLGPVGETQWLDRLEEPPLAIIGHANLSDPAALERQLDAHSLASGRLRGIRDTVSAHPAPVVHTWTDPARLSSDEFRNGYATLGERQLSFEMWCYSNQLLEVAALADAVPTTKTMLDHMGTPAGLAGPFGGVGETAADRDRIKKQWHEGLQAVAEHRNVHVKLSGLLMPICGFAFHERPSPPSTSEVVDALGPHILFGIETFGAKRCMLASNFPMDKVSVSYETLYDAFIEIVANAGLSAAEQDALFADNAAAFYRLVEEPKDE